MTSPRMRREVIDVLESVRLSVLRRKYSKLYFKTTTEPRDTSRWKMAQTHEIWREAFARIANNVSTQVEARCLFKYEVTGKSFKKFLKFGSSSLPETKLLALILLD